MNDLPWQLALALALVASSCPGCSQHASPNTTVIRVTPASFSAEEIQRLQPDPDLPAARVTFEQSAEPMNVAVNIESWQNGKRMSPDHSSPEPMPDVLSISIRTATTAPHHGPLRAVRVESSKVAHQTEWVLGFFPLPTTSTSKTGHWSAFDIPTLSKGADSSVKMLDGPVELTPNHPVAVWAYVAGRGIDKKPAKEPIDATVARTEWALVVTITLNKTH